MEAGKVCLDAAIGSNGYGVAEGESAGSILVDTIDDLNESKQRVIKLRLEGFSFGEIARLNHWTYRKTCNIFYRGVKDLKQELGKKGIQYED
jgi:DNA-directed RNA polymerase specialized sigma24 family protein